MSVIAITGAGGFIGDALVKHFLEKGHEVIALNRTPLPSTSSHERLQFIHYDLLKEIDVDALKKADAIIHCAFTKWNEENINADEINIRASLRLADFCERENKQFVFMSSFSAHEDALSHYGKHKFELEKKLRKKHLIIKAGLVIGERGLFKEMSRLVATKKIIPVVGKGDQPVQWIHISELVYAIDNLLSKKLKGVFALASEKSITFLQMLENIASGQKKSVYFIFIHPLITEIILKVLGKRAPFTKENLLGLLQLRKFETAESLTQSEIKVDDLSRWL